MEDLKRHAYQAPQTPMERHLMELVAHLRDGTDNRAGFAQKTEAAQDHAFWLEKRCRELQEEVKRLELFMSPSLPNLSCWDKQIDTRDPSSVYPVRGGAVVFDWGMEKIHYRGMWRDGDDGDQATLNRIKRRTYQEILGLFRKEFERTWTLNVSRRKAARRRNA